MKILAVGDLHGRKPKIHFKSFDAIVCIGDVCSDRDFRPLKNKWFKYVENNPEERISLTEYFLLKLGSKKLKELEKKSVQEGRKIMKYLNSFEKPVFFIPGNWDDSYGSTRIKDMDASEYNYFKTFLDFCLGDKINSSLIKGLKNIVDCQYKQREFKSVNILGYGLSSNKEDPSLRKKKSEANYNKEELRKLQKAYNKILDRLTRAYLKGNKYAPTIFLTHNVPYGTKLDKFLDKKSEFNGKHFGSTVARWFCKKYKPVLCIGGHMHEHFGKDKIGKTTLINVGFGSYVNTLIDLNEQTGKIKNIRFWDGKKDYKIKN